MIGSNRFSPGTRILLLSSAFLRRNAVWNIENSSDYGEESGSPERIHCFMGLLVHEDASPSRLELGSSKLLQGVRS